MCRIFSLIVAVCINVSIAVWILSLEKATTGLKLITTPFIVSPVSALLLYCSPRRSLVANIMLTLVALSSTIKLVTCGIVINVAMTSADSNTDLGHLGELVYALLAMFLGLSGFSDLLVVLSTWCHGSKRGDPISLYDEN